MSSHCRHLRYSAYLDVVDEVVGEAEDEVEGEAGVEDEVGGKAVDDRVT